MKYYWFTHSGFDRKGNKKIKGFLVSIKEIENAILNHDWDMFRFYQVLLNRIYHSNKLECDLVFLPNITKEDFMKIDHVEHECG